MRERRSIRADILRGLRIGVYLAAVWSVAAFVVYLATGGKRFEQLGISLPVALAGYALIGILCGAVWGIGRPLARWWWGASVLGFLVAIPACFLVLLVTAPAAAQWSVVVKLSLLMSVAFGPVAGIMVRRDSR